MNGDFWHKLEALLDTCPIVIDRPKGSCHPRIPQAVYPLDYGYLQGTTGGDGEGIDLWRGSLEPPRLAAVICTVDLAKKDAELKLVLGCTPQEQQAALDFHQSGSTGAILMPRPAD